MAKTVGNKTYTLTVEADGYYRTRPPADTTAPSLNGAVSITDVTDSSFTVSWPTATDTQSGVASYTVRLSTSSNFANATTKPVTGSLSAAFSNLATGTWYVAHNATDNAGNVSPWSGTVTITLRSTATGLLRWAPGHYMRYAPTEATSVWVTNINQWPSTVKGGHLYIYWADLEPSQGVYDWTKFDAVFNACAAAGKKLFFRLQDKKFGQTDPVGYMPQYIIDTNLWYYRITPQLTVGAKLWDVTCMDHIIRVYKAVIDRYASNGTTLVGISGQETVLGGTLLNGDGSAAGGYSAMNYSVQEVRRMQQLRAYAPQLMWFTASSWFSGDTNARAAMVNYFTAGRADKGVMFNGGSDMLVNASGSSGTSDGFRSIEGIDGGIDHRGAYAINGNTDADDRNLRQATLDTIYNKAFTTYGANYMFWLGGQAYNGIGPTDIQNYTATHPMVTTVPSQLVGLTVSV